MTCPTCKGEGLLYEDDEDVQVDCPVCNGTGEVEEHGA